MALPALPIQQRIKFSDLSFSTPSPLRLMYKRTIAGPTPLSTTYVPNCGGLYAVLVYDTTCRPRPYRLVYVGEAQNLAERVCRSHEKYDSWVRAACGASLFIAFYAIEDDSARKTAERRIIEHYTPECNKTFNSNLLSLSALLG